MSTRYGNELAGDVNLLTDQRFCELYVLKSRVLIPSHCDYKGSYILASNTEV